MSSIIVTIFQTFHGNPFRIIIPLGPRIINVEQDVIRFLTFGWEHTISVLHQQN